MRDPRGRGRAGPATFWTTLLELKPQREGAFIEGETGAEELTTRWWSRPTAAALFRSPSWATPPACAGPGCWALPGSRWTRRCRGA